ncbi:hypothetical protein IKG16_02670, partial [Candidatus Saccharibacteria bacterium]|nr:hypothetical protein [Candidatus Saccharibacteria bacterium]
ITYATDNTQVFGGIVYMQQMTSAICTNATETTSYTSASTLIDSRGKGNAGSQTGTYKVIKAKDGNCWMADNLNLYNMTGNNAITSTNSDIPSGSYEIPDGITQTSQWGSNIYDRPMIEVAHGLGNYADKNNTHGTWGTVYYNWCAATATSGASSINCNTTTPPDTSICPKGWTLPNGDNQSVNKSWARLFGSDVGYNYTAGSQFVNNTNVLGFALYYGHWHWDSASEIYQGHSGYFWSGTPSSEAGVYRLGYDSGGINPRGDNDKGNGFSIRCVAR